MENTEKHDYPTFLKLDFGQFISKFNLEIQQLFIKHVISFNIAYIETSGKVFLQGCKFKVTFTLF